ncbi:hypothetical protein JCM19037_821 [Geomicrobium sp. JCM 19037]|uniref:S-layer homology domain-containing protein n=1 Tax=Geomicrobium sp. JCM 19037 TaxID=1460634 RepID=UPI00045F437F|nr:S-layer homology domain-containing protein [Geomicrobium sp. JCM 19037]GAK02577.1 hypothetical protein JCM19037_821 [Geomicrobium sp. JCM 19037]
MKKTFVALLSTSLLFVSISVADAQTFHDVSEGYWAEEEIHYISDEGIIRGFSDGNFRPGQEITRSQTAVMLSRALDLEGSGSANFNDVDESHGNYEAIQQVNEAGIMTGRSNGDFNPGEPLNRAQMSAVLTRAFELEADRSVQFRDLSPLHYAYDEIAPVVTNFISTGKGDGSYAPQEHVSRAQFSVFMARAINEEYRPEHTNETFYGEQGSFGGVQLGDSEQRLVNLHGNPEKTLQSVYDFEWHIYHDDYSNYMQYGVSNGEVVAALTPQGNWRADNDITKGTDRSVVESEYGQPEASIVKGNTRYRITNENKGLYNINGNYVTFYYDSHTENTISSVFAIDQEVEDAYDQYYPESSGHVRDLFEEELFTLVTR